MKTATEFVQATAICCIADKADCPKCSRWIAAVEARDAELRAEHADELERHIEHGQDALRVVAAEHAGEVGRLRKALERIAPLGYGCTVECEHPGCIARRELAAPAAGGSSADTRRGTP
jgi:hypothetical protein